MLLADDDLGIQPLGVKVLGGPGIQVREEQLWQTNDANIPAFESRVHAFAWDRPRDARMSTDRTGLVVTYGYLQLFAPKNRMVCTGCWLVIELPLASAAANDWHRYWTPTPPHHAVLELVRRH